MRMAWQVLEDGEPPMGGKEPRLRLGAGDGLEQPLVPAGHAEAPRPARGGTGSVPNSLVPKRSACGSCCVAHQLRFPPPTYQERRVKGNWVLSLETSQESPVEDGHPP